MRIQTSLRYLSGLIAFIIFLMLVPTGQLLARLSLKKENGHLEPPLPRTTYPADSISLLKAAESVQSSPVPAEDRNPGDLFFNGSGLNGQGSRERAPVQYVKTSWNRETNLPIVRETRLELMETDPEGPSGTADHYLFPSNRSNNLVGSGFQHEEIDIFGSVLTPIANLDIKEQGSQSALATGNIIFTPEDGFPGIKDFAYRMPGARLQYSASVWVHRRIPSPFEPIIPNPACSITDLSAGNGSCMGDNAYFTLSFNAVNGSGNYEAVDANTLNVLANVSGEASTGLVTFPVPLIGPASVGSLDVFIRNVGSPSCKSLPVKVSIPQCSENTSDEPVEYLGIGAGGG